ncbi:LysR family transcriptional regulator [Rhizobium halophytocola]|uniref:LysR family nitrogen assimilation transcriptional regulator n=1 Tax=Rhizobium halophytocola TaxID=735519 RepID=A0ABS4E672_9HYPH|nr:LysR family transcriptional regulator [Rhizobium halophytocola]MBP1853416.1 LysR family nitrogen assimilation transcriptional regulator [Rhizobium halophytocola]
MAPLQDISLIALRYFVSVAEEKNFTRAAQRMHIAQPALSRQISKLEAALQTPLFLRSSRGVDLTEAGEVLLTRAYTIFNQIEQTVNDVTSQSHSPRGVVTVGLPPTPGELIAPPLLDYIRKNYPDIELRFREGFSGDLLRMLKQNEIGVAVMHDAPPEDMFISTNLLREHLWVIGKAGTIDRPSYTLAEAVKLPLVMPSRPNFLRFLIDRHAEQHNLQLNVIHRSDGIWITKALVRYGLGYTILTYGGVLSEMQHGTVDAVPITDPQINWTLCTTIHRDQANKPAPQLVIRAIKTIVDDLVAREIWK